MTIDDQWKEEYGCGFQAGFQAGLEQEKREMLQLHDHMMCACMFGQVLENKFGRLSPEIVDRVSRADRDTLEGWIERMWTADTIEAVFGD